MPVAIQTILVATDFSTAAEAATTYAVHLARALGARVTLVHVVPESEAEMLPRQGPLSRAAFLHTCSTNAATHLAALVAQAQAQDLVQACCVVTGQPAWDIVRCASAIRAQLIVVGKHAGPYGRSGREHVFLGSVAERVVHLAACAVLVVPPSQTDPAR
jgi:nucleotide-binding universal stress UspA family protein